MAVLDLCVLDGLDLEPLSTDNGTHLIVRDEKFDGCRVLVSLESSTGSKNERQLTVGAITLDNASHAHRRCAFEQCAPHDGVSS